MFATNDGKLFTGLIARQSSDTLVVRDASGAELLLRKNKIEEMRRATTSLMPEGLERTKSRAELRDLLAFLQSLIGATTCAVCKNGEDGASPPLKECASVPRFAARRLAAQHPARQLPADQALWCQ